MPTGTLSIVSTPIGNLEDMTLRAIRTLKEADLIAAEDTRRARILLNAYGINTPTTSFHAHNIAGKTPGMINKILQGKHIALISDSGTPGISDPGYVFIKECINAGISLCAVPGPTAFVPALVMSGKPTARFVFEGFLSNKKGRRRKQLERLLEEDRTVVVYESPHRIVKFLEDFVEKGPDRDIAIARELTKKFEEVKRGKARELLEHFSKEKPRGEFIIVF